MHNPLHPLAAPATDASKAYFHRHLTCSCKNVNHVQGKVTWLYKHQLQSLIQSYSLFKPLYTLLEDGGGGGEGGGCERQTKMQLGLVLSRIKHEYCSMQHSNAVFSVYLITVLLLRNILRCESFLSLSLSFPHLAQAMVPARRCLYLTAQHHNISALRHTHKRHLRLVF